MPQRRAAVKATANLKDADKPMTKKEEELVLFGEPESKKKKEAEEKAAKKKALEPLWKRYVQTSIFCFDLNFISLSNIGQIDRSITPYYSYFLGLGRLCPLILIPWVRSPFHFEAHVERVHVGEQPLGRLSLGVPASPTRYYF